MASKTLSFRIQGVAPLVMHNGRLADPLNEITKSMKKISGKRGKTDADLEELARLEWYGGLYLDGGKPCIPGEVLEATMIGAAKKSKKGKVAQATVWCPENYLLEYEGSKNPDDLWGNDEFRFTVGVRIQASRIMRTRPTFKKWASNIKIDFDDSVINPAEIEDMLRVAGSVIGMMDWRPRFGRFEIVK